MFGLEDELQDEIRELKKENESLKLQLSANKEEEKLYTKEDLGKFLEFVRNNYTGFGAPHLVHNKGGQHKTGKIVDNWISSINT